MADYRETQVTGSSYVRAKSVLLDNPKNGVGTITFDEEKWFQLDAEAVSKPVGRLQVVFDPAGVIDLRDPVTGDLTGEQTTQAEVYRAIYSFYFQKALERDAAQ